VGVSSVDLITATLDLQLVRMLRQAIRTADQSSAAASCHAPPQQVIEPRPRIHPEPFIAPRPHIHPTPRFEPRPVIQPTRSPISDDFASTSPPRPVKSPPVFQPPWRVLPWEKIAPPAPKLKLTIKPPDAPRRGSVFDVFI